ncbi:MAG: hypothetical protein IKL82_02965 [Clostridia bacterium]|nr:hypothetical protein [Clostridia bacterium]
MGIEKYDSNFSVGGTIPSTNVYFNALDIKNALYGVFYDHSEGLYRRLPKSISSKISEAIEYTAKCTAGGRLKLKTNSPYISVKAVLKNDNALSVMTACSQFGFSVIENQVSHATVHADVNKVLKSDSEYFTFEGVKYLYPKDEHELTIYFPLYGSVKELYVGVKEGCFLEKGSNYLHEKPVVFYGSSVTQGGCASRPDTCYVSMLSEMLNFNFINLGFAGNCLGELEISDYIASLDASCYVMGYDYNAPNPEYLEKTHLAFYKELRAKKPNVPILIISGPSPDRVTVNVDGKNVTTVKGLLEITENDVGTRRASVVYQTYLNAKQQGDENVYFINGKTLLGEEGRYLCTVDGAHPNDVGFYRMAQTIYPVLNKILNK